MSAQLSEQLALLPERLGAHLGLTVLSLGVGLALSVPLSLLALRWPRLRWPVLTAASVVQTVPALALLALMVPTLDLLRRHALPGLPAFGFVPAAAALVLYSLLPVLRNTVTSVLGVEPSLLEAARGLGMTPRQTLVKVQLPLAAPLILAGVRTAAVWTVGVATLSTPVGQTSLGNYIFSGLQTRNWTAVLVGCAAAAVLAVVLDATLALLQSAVAQRSRARAWVALALLAAVAAGGLWPFVGRGSTPSPVRIGSKTFTEQYLLAELLATSAEGAGFGVERVESLGSTIVFDALIAGELDAYVDYSGTLWANHMGRTDVADADTVLRELTAWLAPRGVTCLGRLGFENAYALAMRRDRAEALGIKSISDLAPLVPRMKLGSDYEFFSRPEWKRLKATYALQPAEQVSFDSSFMYQAVQAGEVEVITAFSSDGRIAAYDLVVLTDPLHAFPPYDAVLLLGPRARTHPGLGKALEPLVGSIDVETMRRANQRVDLEGESRAEAAAWLRRAAHLGP